MEAVKFIVTCAATFAVMLLLAVLAEKFVCKDRKPFKSTHYISYTAVFSCMAGALMLLEIPIFFIPSFYKIDLSELPILICTFYLGPVAGVVSELLKILLKLLIKGTTTAFVGDYANFVIGCTFVLPASIVYHAKPGKRSALIGMIAGTLCMTVFGSAFNAWYLLPKYSEMYSWPLDQIIAAGTKLNSNIKDIGSFVFFAVVPFNLIKGAVDSALTFLLYKRISPLLHKGDSKKNRD